MVLVGGLLGVGIAPAFLGHDVDEHGAGGLGALHLLEDGDEVVHVVAVDGADVVEAELLEQGRARPADHPASVLVNLGSQLMHRPPNLLRNSLVHLTKKIIKINKMKRPIYLFFTHYPSNSGEKTKSQRRSKAPVIDIRRSHWLGAVRLLWRPL